VAALPSSNSASARSSDIHAVTFRIRAEGAAFLFG
jgi:hypothetical protein